MTRLFEEHPTLARALLRPLPAPVVAPLAAPGLTGDSAFGLDLILEGFLLHHGNPRLLRLPDEDRVLAGDFCYAQGLVRVAESGDLRIIRELADLIALSTSLVATGETDRLPALWRSVVATIADRDPAREQRLEAVKAALRSSSDHTSLTELARSLPPTPTLDEVFDA